MRKLIAVMAATIMACLALSSSAFAWGGAKIEPLSCPEIHFNAPPENGPWKLDARLGQINPNQSAAKRVADFLALPSVPGQGPWLVTGDVDPQVQGKFYLPSDAPTVVTVALYNAANPNDGFVYQRTIMSGCGPLPTNTGPAGPAGPPGTPGQNGSNGTDGSNGSNGTNGSNGSNGSNGRDGVNGRDGDTTAPTCTSNRIIKWTIRAKYPGSRNDDGKPVVGIDRTQKGPSLTLPNGQVVSAGRGIYTGFDSDGRVIETSVKLVTKGKLKGRYQATVVARGHKFTGYNNTLRVTVWLKLEGEKHSFRTSYFADVCRAPAGNPNDQRSRSPEIPSRS